MSEPQADKDFQDQVPDGYKFGPPQMDDFDIVITDEPPEEEEPSEDLPEEFKDLKKGDLIKKLQETQASYDQRLEELKSQQTSAQGVESLAEQLKKALPQQQQGPQQPPPPPQLSKEQWNEKYAEDPFEAMQEFYAHKLGPEINRLLSNNVSVSKKFLTLDQGRSRTYERYQSEIDNEVNKLPIQERVMNSDVYKEAHDRVVARHLDDVISEKVQEALKQEGRGQSQEQPQPQPQAPKPRVPYDEPGVRRQPSQGGPKKVYLTPEEKAFGARRGIAEKDLARLKSNGKLNIK